MTSHDPDFEGAAGAGVAYDGTIDWNAIYRLHYDMPTIHTRLQALIGASRSVLFAGFAEVAARLSAVQPVHFVEHSEAMVLAAAVQYPCVGRMTRGDIVDVVRTDHSIAVLVTCRVSAYWHEPGRLAAFLQGVARHPRELLVVDFFDAARRASNATLGQPEYSSPWTAKVRERSVPSRRATVTLARVQGRYTMGETVVRYDDVRAFYRPHQVHDIARDLLPGAQVSIEPPLVEDDAGFTLVARW